MLEQFLSMVSSQSFQEILSLAGFLLQTSSVHKCWLSVLGVLSLSWVPCGGWKQKPAIQKELRLEVQEFQLWPFDCLCHMSLSQVRSDLVLRMSSSFEIKSLYQHLSLVICITFFLHCHLSVPRLSHLFRKYD